MSTKWILFLIGASIASFSNGSAASEPIVVEPKVFQVVTAKNAGALKKPAPTNVPSPIVFELRGHHDQNGVLQTTCTETVNPEYAEYKESISRRNAEKIQ